MPDPASPDSILILKSTIHAADPDEIVQSNVGFVNSLLHELLRIDEVPPDAVRSYYVD